MPPRPVAAQALEDALDAQRQAGGLTWTELGRRLHIAPTTMRGMAARPSLEMDGVICMVRWLGRSVESFTALPDALAGHRLAGNSGGRDEIIRVALARLGVNPLLTDAFYRG